MFATRNATRNTPNNVLKRIVVPAHTRRHRMSRDDLASKFALLKQFLDHLAAAPALVQDRKPGGAAGLVEALELSEVDVGFVPGQGRRRGVLPRLRFRPAGRMHHDGALVHLDLR